MAKIVGPSNGHATLTGTSANDLFLAYGEFNTITGGGGQDTINALSGGYNTISVGTTGDGKSMLKEAIHVWGVGDTITGGDENVSLAGTISNSTASFGHGSNTVRLTGSGNTINALDGDNTITMLGGSDTVSLSSGEAGQAYSDRMVFSGAHNSVVVNLSAGGIQTAGALDIFGGSGFGDFELGASHGTLVTGGFDNDISAGWNSYIVAGSGYDYVALNAGPRASGATNVIVLHGTHNVVTGLGAGFDSISGGTGYNTVDISLDSGTGDIALAGQHNAITVEALITTVNISHGGSYESVDLTSSQNANLIFNGVGDQLTLGSDSGIAETTNVIDQSSGLNVILNKEVFTVADHLTLADFDATGLIDFKDGRGGFTSVAQIVHDLKSTGPGDYSLTLPDGSGTITITGDLHLTAANFKLG